MGDPVRYPVLLVAGGRISWLSCFVIPFWGEGCGPGIEGDNSEAKCVGAPRESSILRQSVACLAAEPYYDYYNDYDSYTTITAMMRNTT